MKESSVSQEQLDQEYLEEFAELDKNGDGVITRDEFLTQLGTAVESHQASMESEPYYRKAFEMLLREFDQLDLDDDGRITKDEFLTVRREAAAVTEDYREFLALDKDATGYLAIDELPHPAQLVKYDLDGDGRVRLDEFLAARRRARVEARAKEKAST
jgi:Ca2+-binding EF-hand superfamily protein